MNDLSRILPRIRWKSIAYGLLFCYTYDSCHGINGALPLRHLVNQPAIHGQLYHVSHTHNLLFIFATLWL
ncbi:hypothetical protein MtrunA17_Chr1g0182351 [Medicago truncatula]|uniref:Uncharacterized protein n=1 Tax=Medicago truncatula TaxID=3880 RepID=A0A396JNM6_MEDTR|nr:hypothetical protein MtrunA17_Chr1g0182351 [Medicago truncatula]